jgi:membrane protease YdiL (CAAX protease family)
MLLHGLLFILLLFFAALSARGLYQKFLFALSLAPLIRLLSLTMPLVGFPFVFWYMVVGAPLFLAVYSLSKLANLHRPHLGLTLHAPGWQLLIGITGIGFGLFEYYILRPEPLIDQLSWRTLWLPALILLVFTGFLEELIFRGVMQYTALRKFGRFGLWYVAGVFAVLHLGYRSVQDVVFVFVVAVFFGWVVMKTGSIVGVTLSHGLTNISLYLVIPFLLAASPVNSPAPREILAPLPPLPSQVVNTPFQPLPTATNTALPTITPTEPPPTPVPPTATELPTDTPPPPPTVPIYYISPLPPLPLPTDTTLPPTATIEMPTANPVPPGLFPTLSPTSREAISTEAISTQPLVPTDTSVPAPTRTPENTPTIVDLPPTPTEVPLDPTATFTEAALPPTPTATTPPTELAPSPRGVP